MRGNLGTSVVTLSIALLLAGLSQTVAADEREFHIGPASNYPNQTAAGLQIGAEAFAKEEQEKLAFGKKSDLRRNGILPVLVVVDNKGKKAVDLRDIEVNLMSNDGQRATSIPPDQLSQTKKVYRRNIPTGIPIPIPQRKKTSMSSPDIFVRAFSARVVPPGDSASGFFYFKAQPELANKVYVNGLREVGSAREIMYFEFSIDRP